MAVAGQTGEYVGLEAVDVVGVGHGHRGDQMVGAGHRGGEMHRRTGGELLHRVGQADRVALDEEHRLDVQSHLAAVHDGGDLGTAAAPEAVETALGRRGGGTGRRREPAEAHPAVHGERFHQVLFVRVEAGTGGEAGRAVGVPDEVRLGGGQQGRLRRAGQGVGAQHGQGPQIEEIADQREVT
ncbi:hypothetical protein STSU_001850 [Streptomyces tsukubensis NRRL18488]|uniref:Uncharacterized protein n=1 Tax=Streptomyces tsukubensis (strain DSM 42081 / NBRC 108919 / NRRL 18488 / 9993) TaxID=1114943 RepID=A0A7G3U6S0_STRT9|nr:hypothetical protein STSU_001850 [Streptomyces tsukubensis NRRL18488]